MNAQDAIAIIHVLVMVTTIILLFNWGLIFSALHRNEEDEDEREKGFSLEAVSFFSFIFPVYSRFLVHMKRNREGMRRF